MRKRVIAISTSFPSAGLNSGSEAAGGFVADFVRYLSKHADVTIIAPGLNTMDETRNGVRIRWFTVPRLPLSLLKPHNPMHWYAIIATLAAGSRLVRETLASEDMDHILALWALPSGYWARSGAQGLTVPFSIWALGSDIWTLEKIPAVRGILRGVLRSADNLFADGLQLAEDVARISGKDCHYLPSSRTLKHKSARNPATTAPFRLAFLGRWHPNKGTDILLESLALLTNDDWGKISEVRICGGGPLASMVKQRAAELRATGRPVTVGGYLGKSEAIELLSWTDVVLIPSRIESIPVVFSDALQLRRPVVAMPVGDLPKLLRDHRVGFLADEVSPSAFSLAIRAACSSNTESLISAIDTVAAEFDTEAAVNDFLLHIESKGAADASNAR